MNFYSYFAKPKAGPVKTSYIDPSLINIKLKNRSSQLAIKPSLNENVYEDCDNITEDSLVDKYSSVNYHNNLPSKSFLNELGYSISNRYLSREERKSILKKAILRYGDSAVIKHIEYLIKDRGNQKRGCTRNGYDYYFSAINEWKHDLQWLKSLKA